MGSVWGVCEERWGVYGEYVRSERWGVYGEYVRSGGECMGSM